MIGSIAKIIIKEGSMRRKYIKKIGRSREQREIQGVDQDHMRKKGQREMVIVDDRNL